MTLCHFGNDRVPGLFMIMCDVTSITDLAPPVKGEATDQLGQMRRASR